MMATWNGKLAGTAVLALLPILAAAGCTGSNVVSPAAGQLIVQVVSEPPAPVQAYPNGGPYQLAGALLAEVSVRPADSRSDQVFNDQALGFFLPEISRPFVSFLQGDRPLVVAKHLNAGTYLVDGLRFFAFELNTQKVDLVEASNETGCLDGKVQALYSKGATDSTDAFLKIVPQPELRFTLTQGGTVTIRIVVDGESLVQLLDAGATCASPNGVSKVTRPDLTLEEMQARVSISAR